MTHRHDQCDWQPDEYASWIPDDHSPDSVALRPELSTHCSIANGAELSASRGNASVFAMTTICFSCEM